MTENTKRLRIEEGDLVTRSLKTLKGNGPIALVLKVIVKNGRAKADLYWQDLMSFETLFTDQLLIVSKKEEL